MPCHRVQILRPFLLQEAAAAPGPPLADRDDDELMLLARGGQGAAFDALVRRYQASALNIAVRLLGSAASAKDATQAAFVELYRFLPRYRACGTFTAFWHRLLLNQCRMTMRSHERHRAGRERLAAEPEKRIAPPDEMLLARERQRDVEVALGKLSERLRTVVVLRFSAELSLAEIADVLELPVGTVKSRLFAGLEKLRVELQGERS